MPSATVSLLRFCELTIGDIRTDWCSSRSTFGASRGRSQSKRRSQSSVARPEAIAIFFLSTQDVVTSRIGGANHAFVRRRLSQFFFGQPGRSFEVEP